MLYVTTRINNDAFTANRSLSENRGPEGGFFVPMHLEPMDADQIRQLGEKSFSQNTVDIINLLFSSKLDSWALEFAVGRYPVKLVNTGKRSIVAETWHNPMWRFERMARGVEKAILQSDKISKNPSDWLMVSARIAVLFGIFGELIQDGRASVESPVDIAVPCGNFSAPMAVWYARQMGLPIRNIICCCNENSGTWKLLHKGELRTEAAAVKTLTPLCDYTVPPDLERLIYGTLGQEESLRFVDTCRRGGTYYLEPEQVKLLRKGIYVSVVSQRRMESMVSNIYKSHGYVCDPYTALCFGGISDYRSATGESGTVVILSEESPMHHLDAVARCLGISAAELHKQFNKT